MDDNNNLRDFFISYTGADCEWAEWIASTLEEAAYTTVLQAWDFGVGAHFVNEMHTAAQYTDRTIGVLSHVYIEAYAKLSLKKYRPMAARNEDKKVFSGLL